MQLAKKGIRALGIAESFTGRERSILGGVVMRRDLRMDGMACSTITVGGTDATSAVLHLWSDLKRRDINFLLLSGCVVAWYNIINPDEIAEETGLPVIIVTYEESAGLEEEIDHHFPGDIERLSAYRRLGPRTPIELHTGYTIYIRTSGISTDEAARLCNAFTLDGKTPEPVKAAQLLARAVLRYEKGLSEGYLTPSG